jgi:hypothetical protein
MDYLKTDPLSPSALTPSSSCPSWPRMAWVSKRTLSMMRIKVYPKTKRKNGMLSLSALVVSYPHKDLTYCMHSQVCVCSGMMCIKAMARKTPPLKALAMPSTIGDSRKLDDLAGMAPRIAASRKAMIIKIIFIASTLIIFYYNKLL